MIINESDKIKIKNAKIVYSLCIVVCLVLGIIFTNTLVQAQTPSYKSNQASVEIQTANEYFQKQDWQNAISAYLNVLRKEPNNGRAWYRLGVSYISTNQNEKAVEAFTKSVEIGSNPIVMYNLACAYSKLNNVEKAFEWLDNAIAKGFNQVEQLKNDKDFANLQSNPKFSEIVKKMEKAAHPCEFSKEARQFDFWVGRWDVKTQEGAFAGTNTIQRTIGDCALMENWTGAGGGTGKSINYYNAKTKKWYQTWIDDKGDVTNYVGEFKDNIMAFQAEDIDPTGQKILRKLTFYFVSPDLVRQVGQISKDNGSSWATEYDFNYYRHK